MRTLYDCESERPLRTKNPVPGSAYCGSLHEVLPYAMTSTAMAVGVVVVGSDQETFRRLTPGVTLARNTFEIGTIEIPLVPPRSRPVEALPELVIVISRTWYD